MSDTSTAPRTEIVKLSVPLKTHKGTINQLELTSPKAGLFIDHGEPFKMRFVNDVAEFDYPNNKAVMGFLANMSGHDAIILSNLEAKDFLLARTTMTRLIMGIVQDDPTE